MKLYSKRTSLLILIFVGIYLMAKYAINYWFGYYLIPSGSYSLFLLCRDFFWLFRLLIIPVFFAFLIISMIQKKDRLRITVMVIGLLALVGTEFILPHPKDFIVFGLRDQVMHDYSLDTLRQFARTVDQLPTPENLPPNLGKVFMSDDLILLETRLKEKYSFLKNRSTPSAITENNSVVNVWWGRHEWGFSVMVTGEIIDPVVANPDAVIILPVSNGIFFSASSYGTRHANHNTRDTNGN